MKPLTVQSPNKCKVRCGCDQQALPLQNYCAAHFVEEWWMKAAREDDGINVRTESRSQWIFSVISHVDSRYFFTESVNFMGRKLGNKLRAKFGKKVEGKPCPPPGSGHTFIKLRSNDKGISVGMFGAGVVSPDPFVRCFVRNIDNQRAVDYRISDAQKNQICDVIEKWLLAGVRGLSSTDEETPTTAYSIMGANCTLFARACCQAAGLYFLGSRIPTYSGKHGFNFTFTPNRLYSSMRSSRAAYNPRLQAYGPESVEGEHQFLVQYPPASNLVPAPQVEEEEIWFN